MKHLITIVLLLALMPIVHGLTEAAIYRPMNVTCTTSGNLELNILYSGRGLSVDDVDISAANVDTGESFAITDVSWINQFNETTKYLAAKTEGALKYGIKTGPNLFLNKGNYKIDITYFAKEIDPITTTTSFITACPGISCISNVECPSNSFCSNESTCVPVNCKPDEMAEFNQCVPRCDDRNICTKDTYSRGECRYEAIAGCCNTDAECNDAKACTTGICKNNQCIFQPVVCASSNDKCVIAECIEPKGCVYKTDEVCLVGEKEKREYMIVIGEPKVTQKSFGASIADFVKNLFLTLFGQKA